jgi:alpha-L-rhamnosidase
MSYRLLALDKYSKHMSLPVLRALHKLVEQGAVVAGEKPLDTPSLADDAAEFKKLSDELFGAGTGVRNVGKGSVYTGQNAEAALKALHVAPDFDYAKPANGQQIAFAHRKLADGDLYFLDNRGDSESAVDASFRVTGRAPELWYSETGKTAPASFTIAGGRTNVPLHFEPWGTVFVIFRKPTKETSHTVPKANETQLATVDGPWTVAFQSGRGAPESIALDKLISWDQSSDKGVKYFSGTGTYTKTIQASPDWFKKGAMLWIDLGDVKNLAVVTVNGKELGTVWHAPYRVDVTAALKPGSNEVSVKVINAWVNRLIGDLQPDASKKYTLSSWPAYKKDSPLLPSGLIGPVAILQEVSQ